MKILVVGRGGREHAVVKKFKRDGIEAIFCAPGNPGMHEATLVDIEETQADQLAAWAKENDIDLTVVGPEMALMAGVVDAFEGHGLKAFGPKKAAAYIEGSKAFAKRLMKKYSIPTAAYGEFDHTQVEDALAFLETQVMPIVIKADGLAAGKGVVICQTLEEAKQTINEMLVDASFGEASARVVIEEFLDGEEFSLMSFVAGDKFYPMPIARDYKRAYDHDEGLNTGGMGAHSPHPLITDEDYQQALETVIKPTVDAMMSEGLPFTGVLYAGLIKTADGPKVIEFNARFGDPETEVVLPLLETDLSTALLELMAGKDVEMKWRSEQTVGVVLAAKGYPAEYVKGVPIKALDTLEDVDIYHMGTDVVNGECVTNGGRVLFVVAKGADLAAARAKVYHEIKKIDCDDLFYRGDIAQLAESSEASLN
ncbi:MAG: phosphoribosylamine--glycine ligase [Defluviitaleaceae bacterium]|nr:phosphoribosylamine--glycine ligase [Defluviitaleaceae bacterium]